MNVNDRSLFARALVMSAVLTVTASGGAIRHDGIDAVYLNLGMTFTNVGQIAFSNDSGDYLGSGTLIAPDWVLTAAHAVDGATQWQFLLGGDTYSADLEDLFPHPEWNGDLLGGYDIGLAKLASPVDVEGAGISPAVRYTGANELGQIGTAVGFGKTGTGLTGAVTYDGLKRAGQNVIDEYYETMLPGDIPGIVLSDFDSGSWLDNVLSGQMTPRDYEYLIGPGDSGGGLFVPGGGGWLLAGVHSFVLGADGTPDSDYGDVSGHTRVSVFNDWIDATIASNQDPTVFDGDLDGDGFVGQDDLDVVLGAWGTAPPSDPRADPSGDGFVGQDDLDAVLTDWGKGAVATALSFQSVPEPAALSLLALGGLALMRRKRR